MKEQQKDPFGISSEPTPELKQALELWELAQTYADQQKWAAAVENGQAALDIAERVSGEMSAAWPQKLGRWQELQQAENLMRQARQLAQKRNFSGAIEAGQEALAEARRLKNFHQYGRWEDEINRWRIGTGDEDAIKRHWRKRVFKLVPAWLVAAVASTIAIGGLVWDPLSTWYGDQSMQDEVNTLIKEGIADLDLGHLDEAKSHFSDALVLDELNTTALLGVDIAEVYRLSGGQYNRQVTQQRVSDLFNRVKDEPSLQGHVLTVQGNLLFYDQMGQHHTGSKASRFHQAREKFSKALERRHKIVSAQLGLAAIGMFDADIEMSRRYFQKALAQLPENISALSGLAFLDAATGQYAASKQKYEQILSWEPDRLQERLELATILRMLGDFNGALAQQQRAHKEFNDLVQRPKNAKPWALLVFRDPPEPPWIASKLDVKKFYLEQNLAATQCLIDTSVLHVDVNAKAGTLSAADKQSVVTLIVLELKAIAMHLPRFAPEVQACINKYVD